MALRIRGGISFDDVERLDLSNFILFRQWERHPASERTAPLRAIAPMAFVLLIVAIGVLVAIERPAWALAIFALGLVVISSVAFYRRSLRFNSLIIAKGFIVWETQCSQTWRHLLRPFRFRHLNLPFKLKDSPLLIPVDEITNWSVQENERADESETTTVRIVLWRGPFALLTFFLPSRDRAGALEKAIRAAIEGMNPAEASP